MAKLKSLFSTKKAKNDTDGQEEYFREDFPPVVNKPSTKTEEKPEPAKKVSEAKKPTKKKSRSANRVAPQQVDRIVNPKAPKAKTSTKSTAKPAAKKETEKPAVKTESKKSVTKPAVKSDAKKVASKPAVKAETKKVVTKAEPKNATVKKATPKKKAETKPKNIVTEELYDDSPEVKGAVAIQESRESANGKWDIRRAKDGRFFFSLYASNHVVIAYSQIYSSTTAVTTGINSVIANASKAETEDTTLKKSVSIPCPKWEIYYDKAEQYRFRLYAPNGLVVCHSSHGYATKSGCKGGIESIKRFSVEARVDKSYLNKE